MQITGLSNQWGERLFEQFHPDDTLDDRQQQRNEATLQLLEFLATLDGPNLWVGTSFSQLNLCARDVRSPEEYLPPLAHLECWPSQYKISYAMPREFRAWPHFFVTGTAGSMNEAAELLLTAIACSDANPLRPSAEWMWFVCPECDFHMPGYSQHCAICRYKYPPERKAIVIGMYRKPKLPEGAVAPDNSG